MGAASYRYDGKRALVVGGATGMGAATAQLVKDLGAEVVVMDHAPVELDGVTAISLDLRDRAGIDAAVDECGGRIDALFSCAGVADGTPGIEKINFIGHRHLIDRAIDAGMLGRGSAIGMISSSAGLAWEKNLERLKEYLDTPDFDSAVAWVEAHPGTADYMWSKQAVCAYVARQSFAMLQKGIRLNAILPGPTETPLALANKDLWLEFGKDFRDAAGVDASTPEEQADVLAFVCSDAARYLNGQTIIVDAGYTVAGATGSFPAATPAVDFLYGRY
ncbi:SDR family oxidoreductase [Rhabdothermincola salaria]|uniref:SDR family oxidoreductase n=1 Tax=Rhabdothermincola salaria TaxID=2903142 RepID=UPI001E30D966|nr:SDR family oxidoreductase [Rhabdothermincola salaria]MCD9624081.1 SDR family oxidoreductase [Rhabdothermincola salaria]